MPRSPHFGPELARPRERPAASATATATCARSTSCSATDIQAVDGVEFDRDLRVADVGYDLAFLIMDVARRDDDLARALLRGYRAAGGDPGGEALLNFLCAVRALVRAKVDFLRAAQLTGAAADDRTARALELLGVAERFAWRARLPAVVCVTGLAASGKSTVAEALAAGRRAHPLVLGPHPQAARRHRPVRARRAERVRRRREPRRLHGARPPRGRRRPRATAA